MCSCQFFNLLTERCVGQDFHGSYIPVADKVINTSGKTGQGSCISSLRWRISRHCIHQPHGHGPPNCKAIWSVVNFRFPSLSQMSLALRWQFSWISKTTKIAQALSSAAAKLKNRVNCCLKWNGMEAELCQSTSLFLQICLSLSKSLLKKLGKVELQCDWANGTSYNTPDNLPVSSCSHIWAWGTVLVKQVHSHSNKQASTHLAQMEKMFMPKAEYTLQYRTVWLQLFT